MPPSARRAGEALLGLLFLVGAVALIRDTYYQGQDFEVFWAAGRALLEGKGVYVPRADGMVFKYPPWIATLFVPLGMMPLGWAKWTWGGIEVLCLVGVLRWVLNAGVSVRVALMGMVLYWGIWAVHCLDGQVALPMLAALLWSFGREAGFYSSSLAAGATVKAGSALALVGAGRGFWSVRGLRYAVGALLLFSLPALWVTPGKSPVTLASAWASSATSGGMALAGDKIRGRDNQGLPALFLRAGNVPAGDLATELWVAAGCALIAAAAWFWASRRMDPKERWSGWLAVSVIAHPLAWVHSFVLVFPLAVIALDRAIKGRRWPTVILAVAGFACIALVSRNTVGWALGEAVELWSIRSIGALASLVALRVSVRT